MSGSSDEAIDQLLVGNAVADSAPFRSWLIGNFIPPELGLRSTRDVEVKWGVHARGETRSDWGTSPHAVTLSLLLRGVIRIFFEDDRQVLLKQEGDYAMWSPGVGHRWAVEADETVVVTVRWPSRPSAA